MSNELVEKLKVVLADSYTLFIKTQNYHWNVTGSNFQSLHTLFEEQYNDLFTANDDIAERIRTLRSISPGSYKEFGELTNITESVGTPPKADEMVKNLAGDQEKIVKSLNAALEEAKKNSDEATIDLLVGRIAVHEKNGWMLRSSI